MERFISNNNQQTRNGKTSNTPKRQPPECDKCVKGDESLPGIGTADKIFQL
jgi:hypothetical protein